MYTFILTVFVAVTGEQVIVAYSAPSTYEKLNTSAFDKAHNERKEKLIALLKDR